MSHTQIDLRPVALEELTGGEAPSNEAGRLVVVLQDAEQEALLAGRILDLARARGLDILLAGIAPEAEAEAVLRRKLARIAGFLRDAAPRARPVDIEIQRGRDWLEGLRALLRPGDMLACCADANAGPLRRPLNDVLGAGLDLPVYVFADLPERPAGRRSVLPQVGAWGLSLASIAAFVALATRIVLAVQGWAQSALLLAALGLEIAVIYFVNSLFGSF